MNQGRHLLRRPSALSALLLIGCALVISKADARAGGPGSEGGFWNDLVRDQSSANEMVFQREMLTGEINTSRAVVATGGNRRTLVNMAVLAYENAIKTKPTAAEPHYRIAELLYAYHVGCPGCLGHPLRRAIGEKMIKHWQGFAAKAPLDPRVTLTLFNQALIHTKLATREDLEHALENYRLLIDRSDLAGSLPRNAAVWFANMAETYMMLNQLDAAIDNYQRALDIDPSPSFQYGLAVALDRDGQGARAMEMARRGGPASLAVFVEGINAGASFFVPEGEHHYYLAVAFEALGEDARAIAEFEKFINSGAHPIFQPRAREHLVQLRGPKRK